MDETKECVTENSEACTEDEKKSLQEFLTFVLNRIGDRCDEVVRVGIVLLPTCFCKGSHDAIHL